jgi:hypothetical protein
MFMCLTHRVWRGGFIQLEGEIAMLQVEHPDAGIPRSIADNVGVG